MSEHFFGQALFQVLLIHSGEHLTSVTETRTSGTGVFLLLPVPGAEAIFVVGALACGAFMAGRSSRILDILYHGGIPALKRTSAWPTQTKFIRTYFSIENTVLRESHYPILHIVYPSFRPAALLQQTEGFEASPPSRTSIVYPSTFHASNQRPAGALLALLLCCGLQVPFQKQLALSCEPSRRLLHLRFLRS